MSSTRAEWSQNEVGGEGKHSPFWGLNIQAKHTAWRTGTGRKCSVFFTLIAHSILCLHPRGAAKNENVTHIAAPTLVQSPFLGDEMGICHKLNICFWRLSFTHLWALPGESAGFCFLFLLCVAKQHGRYLITKTQLWWLVLYSLPRTRDRVFLSSMFALPRMPSAEPKAGSTHLEHPKAST